MSQLYPIRRDGELIGVTSDRLLAERIDGTDIREGASDPANAETHQYEVPEL